MAPNDVAEGHAASGEYLTFWVGDYWYGVDVLRVQEIRSYEQPTRISSAPPALLGVINLRGVIVPIFDLRVWMGRESSHGRFMSNVVLHFDGRTSGLIVDGISDVLEIRAEQIQAVSERADLNGQLPILGSATINELTVAVVDIEQLVMEQLLPVFDQSQGQ